MNTNLKESNKIDGLEAASRLNKFLHISITKSKRIEANPVPNSKEINNKKDETPVKENPIEIDSDAGSDNDDKRETEELKDILENVNEAYSEKEKAEECRVS